MHISGLQIYRKYFCGQGSAPCRPAAWGKLTAFPQTPEVNLKQLRDEEERKRKTEGNRGQKGNGMETCGDPDQLCPPPTSES